MFWPKTTINLTAVLEQGTLIIRTKYSGSHPPEELDEAMAQETEVGNTEDNRESSTDDSPSSKLDFLLPTSVVVDEICQRLAFHSSGTRLSATVLVASPQVGIGG